jgi:DMSO/TMAO reductase YedYZ molybdopterin-dependent catalytic subunit
MFAEVLREPITPLAAHYLLIHFDVPQFSDENYTLIIAGRVQTPLQIGLGELKTRPSVTQFVTMQCAGTGRILLKPRPVYYPGLMMRSATYRWTGTPLRPLLDLLDNAVEILFSGWDTGVDLGIEHAFERSLPVTDALRPEVMLAWAANDQPLLPEHGFPLRLIVPSWYGMASVKWLRAITALSAPFMGVQQAQAYRYQQTRDELGEPVREKRLMSLLMPPGIPDMMLRCRFIAHGQHVLQGRAWSGGAPVAKVEVSADGGETWSPAELSRVSDDPFAWVGWRAPWGVNTPGHYTLACRATDAAGSAQPLDPLEIWNVGGNGINAVRKVQVIVQEGIGAAGLKVPSVPQPVLAEAATNGPIEPERGRARRHSDAGRLGGFKWSSQQLGGGRLRWWVDSVRSARCAVN